MLDIIKDMLVQQLGPMGPAIAMGVIGLFVILLFVPIMMARNNDPLRKLEERANAKASQDAAGPKLRHKGKKNKTLDKYSTFLEPKTEEELGEVRLKLLQAGYRTKDAVRYYYFAQFMLGILGLIGGVIYYLFFLGPNPTTQQMIMWVVGPGAAGYMFPKYWITRRVEERKEQIQDGFPDALDMMLVCIEAGQSMDQSIIRVGKELYASFPALAEEFELVSLEMKAGKDKAQVLNDMAERAGVQDVASFVTVLVQSQTFGTSVSEALRVYASEMRDKRVMRAEEKANKLPTKMTLTTMMFTVPPLLIILVGPSVVGIQNMGGP
ncbi:type II secretion system F family protein [Mesobacterium pallidum]|uniref:type II secretion system F family protein n=1 Tax=Mesobacterium pallidum TaxID=2872037 RepID=UPI001EE2C47E|nr:type II secretion system F family protein [Mesobacterium pallidum]